MKRPRPKVSSIRQPSAWLLAVSGVVLYVWAPTMLLSEHRGVPMPVPGWVPWVASPLLYGLLLLGLPGITTLRRVVAIAVLVAMHAALSIATPALLAAAGASPPSRLDLWTFPAVPIIQLFAVPLVAFPFRDRLMRSSRRPRLEGGLGGTPPPLRVGRGWDDLGGHTAGGERLRETPPPPLITLEWRRPLREPSRPTPPPVPRAPFRPVFTPSPLDVDVFAPPPPPPVVEASPASAVAPPPAPPIEPPVVEPAPPPSPIPVYREPAPAVAVEIPALPPPAPAAARPAEPAESASEAPPSADPSEIRRALAPVGTLELASQTLMGITLVTAWSPRLAKGAVVTAAYRFLSFLAESPDARAVSQTTLRGAAGAMVLTPLGPPAAGGPVLAAAIPQRGALALLEILSLRVAADYRAAHAGLARPGAASPADPTRAAGFHEKPAPPRMDTLARSLGPPGALRPLGLEDPSGRLLLYLLLAPDADAQRLGRFAADLYRLMEVEAEPGGVGPVQSVVVRLGSQRVVVRLLTASPERSTLLVATTAGADRPGLVQFQLERVATRLAAPSA